MPEEIEVLTGRARAAAEIVIALVVASGIFLRFYTHSALWLDEALTVDRSSLPVRDIATSLKQDGAPPLYYYLLHYWMDLFGQSDLAIRSLSGVIGVATLPVAWFAANRFGGRIAAWVTLVLLASAPYAGVLLHRGAHVLPRDPAHGVWLPRPDPGPGAAPSGEPHCDRRRDSGAALHPVLVPLPRGNRRDLAAGLGLVGSARGEAVRGHAPLARFLRGGGRLPVVRAVAADVPLPVAAHRHALGETAELRRHRLRAHRVSPTTRDPWRSARPRVACSQ